MDHWGESFRRLTYLCFFIGVFVANSLFFSFDSFSQVCELFQEKIAISNDSGLNLLKIIPNKLSLFEESIGLPSSEVYSIKPKFGFFAFYGCDFSKIEIFSNFVKKFLEYCNESYANSILSFYHFLKQVSSINDFLFDNSFQNSSINLLYVLQENQLDYSNFINFKMYLIESNYYEDIKLDEFCSVSKENTGIIENFSGNVVLNNNLISDFRLNNVYNLLDCVSRMIRLSDFLQNYGLNTFAMDTHLVNFPEEFGITELTNWSCLDSSFQDFLILQSYMFSITHMNGKFIARYQNKNAFFIFLFMKISQM